MAMTAASSRPHSASLRWSALQSGLGIALACIALVAGCGKDERAAALTKLAGRGITNSPATFIRAAWEGNIETVGLFLQAGLDPNSRKEVEGGTVTALHAAVDGGNREIAVLLLQRGADVDARAPGQHTVLHAALGRTNVDLTMVDLLITNGANVNAASDRGVTPLISAVQWGHLGAVELLLSKGADVNAATTNGYTALMIAAGDDNVEAVKSLLKAKPNLNARGGKLGQTALELAVALDHTNVLEVLRQAENVAASGPLVFPIPYEERERARLKLGQTGLEFTPDDFIRKAVWNNDSVAVKLFLDAGMDVNCTIPNRDGGTWTALAFAAERGNPELVKLLLSRSAKITTELVDAASGGNVEVVNLLVQRGARVRVGRDGVHGWGKTPLYAAVLRGHADIVRLLLQNKAYDPRSQEIAELDFDGSFLGTAMAHRHVEVVKVLIEHKVDCGTAENVRLALKTAEALVEASPVSGDSEKWLKARQVLEVLEKAFPDGKP